MDVESRGVKRGPEAPPGLGGGSDSILQEILATVKNTDSRVTRLQGDVSEAKQMAAKSLVQSEETRQELVGLKKRIERVEKGGSSSGSSQGSGDPWFRARQERDNLRAENNLSASSRFDSLGGPRGTQLIMGGFPKCTRTDKLKEYYEALLPQMGELAGEIKMMQPPGTRGHILQIELKENATLRESRLATLDFVKKFKGLGLAVKLEDVAYPVWASPSKPEVIRAQDRETTTAVQVLKLKPC